VSSRGQRTDIHSLIQAVALHADAVAQNSPPGEWACRVDREHPHVFSAFLKWATIWSTAYSCRLRRACDTDDIGVTRVAVKRLEDFPNLWDPVINIPDQPGHGPHIACNDLVNGVCHHATLGFTCSLTHFTISSSLEPGVKISAIPASFSFGMSSSGMIPPPHTTMSSTPFSRRSLTTSGNRYMCAPARLDIPSMSTSSWIAA